jgi:hypothetical protein
MATYKHLRSSTAHKRPTTTIVDGQLAINTNTASPGLFFKDSAGTGIVKVGPVHVGTTAPNSTPASGGSTGNYTGEQWLDTSVSPAQMKVWNGSTWVGIVADELPVSKLQDGAARQLIQTDAAGTDVEWTSSIDLPGTLDVTSTATFDSIAQHPLGTAGAPTITFTGDTNTGIYSPGADQVAISTNGTGRLFVDSSGRVGVATASPAFTFDLTGTFRSTGEGRFDNGINLKTSTLNYVYFDDAIAFSRNGTGERMRLDSSGRVGIGTTPVVDLDVAPAASTATFRIHARSNTTPVAAIELVRGANTTWGNDGYGDYRIKNDGGNLAFEYGDSSVGNSERARIDSSGRLLVGTSTSTDNIRLQQKLAIVNVGDNTSGGVSVTSYAGTTNSTTRASLLDLNRSRGTTDGTLTKVENGDRLGLISFRGADGSAFIDAAAIEANVDGATSANDMPGRLVFSTTADSASSPTERFRITNDGVIAHDQPAPAAVNATATLTIANLKAGIITSTSAAATDMTLPTGTDTQAGFSGTYDNFTFEWSVINTGPSLVRVLAGTAHTIVGSGSVATGTSGRFASRRTAANTFATYRLS